MKRIPVSSSNIAAIGYDSNTQTLEVEFNSGSIYQYFDVPQTIYEALINAESVGKCFIGQIKGYYRYAKA
ncbi:hypothetical protein BAC3_00170 [uncultured bacterium]|nr:hypothetical protein BAC3_00170 [uncultured bacterium]